MEMVQDRPTLSSNHYYTHHHQHHQSEDMAMTFPFDEQLAAAFGEDFPYPLSAESNTSSPDQWEFDYAVMEPFSSPPFIPTNDDNNNNSNNDNNMCPVISNLVLENRDAVTEEDDQGKLEKESKQETTRTKRKREPGQVQDHIMAERKRRQLLTQRFIALSAIVPGLKKMDKTSVLGDAIKYMKELQEQVKKLEEAAARRTVESVVIVKKSHLVVDDDNSANDNDSSCTTENYRVSGGGNNPDNSLPQIEVRALDKNILIKVYCEKRKGDLAKLFAEVEEHGMSVVNSSVLGFGSLALDITIVAQMEEKSNKKMNDLIKALRSNFS